MFAKRILFLPLFALVLLSCRDNWGHAVRNGVVMPRESITVALEKAMKELSKTSDLKKPFELAASVNDSGDWMFSFYLLPRTPGAEVIVVVRTNVVTLMPGI